MLAPHVCSSPVVTISIIINNLCLHMLVFSHCEALLIGNYRWNAWAKKATGVSSTRPWLPYAVKEVFCHVVFAFTARFSALRDFTAIWTYIINISRERRNISPATASREKPFARSLGGQGGCKATCYDKNFFHSSVWILTVPTKCLSKKGYRYFKYKALVAHKGTHINGVVGGMVVDR